MAKRHRKCHRKRRIKVCIGTDCSGTDAPIYGLRQTRWFKKGRVKVDHRWACDTNPGARRFITLNHKPKKVYNDIFKSNHSLLPRIDCYVNGFDIKNNK